MDPASHEGLVLRIDAKTCHVEVAGQRHVLPLRGRLFEDQDHRKKPIAVGDRVRVRLHADGSAIETVLPRQTELHRQAAGGEAKADVVAANVTLVLAVASVAEPPFQPELVDGVLAAAARERIPSALALTKTDLHAKDAARWSGVYQGAGCRVFPVSIAPGHRTEQALRDLKALLHENRTVLCGVSGAGKSSLLNALVPGLELRIGPLSHVRQGTHTTTRTELVPLPGGGHVLDTPGVRSFYLFHAGAQELAFYFPEIERRRSDCEYRNCLHDGEPGCAVLPAVERGEVAESRYRSYLSMLARARSESAPGAGPGTGAAGAAERRRRPGPRRRRR